MLKKLLNNIEHKIGLNINEIYQKNPMEIRKIIESKYNDKLTYSSEFPFIGRGNVLRDSLVQSKQLDDEIDLLLGIK
jgi:hypothetical protein